MRVLGGISERPLLTREDMVQKETANGGIIVVGSHTDKTTRQLSRLREREDIAFIELDATLVRDEGAFEQEVARCLAEDELRLPVRISDAVQSLVGRLSVTPAFVVAKGGITSSDVGTKALAVKKARVLGQIQPGIPVWQTGAESRFPGTPYVIFPGNVGEDGTLKAAAEVLLGGK